MASRLRHLLAEPPWFLASCSPAWIIRGRASSAIASREAFVLAFRFDGDRLTLDIRERTHESGFTVSARPQAP
jgi:hypothetical protein